ELAINPLLLADDRSLYSDDEELERVREQMSTRRERRQSVERTSDLVARELTITLRRANDWLRTLTLRGQNVGSAGANSIYLDVLRRFAAGASEQGVAAEDEESTDEGLSRLLTDLGARSQRFEEYELVPHFASEEFIALLRAIPPGERGRLAQDVLKP